MGAADDRQHPSGWISASGPIDDADHPPARAWNDASWAPPHDNYPATAVTLMPEYGVELPLWGADWWELRLTPQLLDELADSQAQFDINLRPETAWLDDTFAAQWERRADELASAVAKQLPPDLAYQIDLCAHPPALPSTAPRTETSPADRLTDGAKSREHGWGHSDLTRSAAAR